eukprot:jgi/Tetstr1/422146/TSEL_013001.t1
MIDFACVSSTTPTWSNDPRWCTPGIAATEAEHVPLQKIAASETTAARELTAARRSGRSSKDGAPRTQAGG